MKKPLYLVAVDGSQWSLRAVDRAIDLASKTGAKVMLLMVKDWSYLQPVLLEGTSPIILDQTAEDKDTRAKVLLPLVEKYHNVNVEIATDLIWGDPATVIKEQIKALHVNMLFVGRQGRSRIVDILLGSVANKLAHHVGIPIVLVP
ncbi:universal stress protein [Colwellia sp. MB3u-70]|uniref:universal stress protein n=1 Tax=unclassified Colwellia TaxID=196834 RepID=UPI0015F5BF4E|nr:MULTISPECIES: universal stress protein [unclassified Colwellia]MBA6293265.1 universal stress protein [Colwellia sp. MB3u-8]MBA6307827.1 universal stress protein [Colwellia sp. MB3u-70]